MGGDLEVLDCTVAVAGAPFDDAEGVVRDRSRNSLDAGLQVCPGGGIPTQLGVADAALEMVVEPAGVATNGFGVGAFGTLVVLAPSQHVALERVEQRLAGRDRDGPLRQLHGLGGIAIAERLAPFIVSLVGWLGAFEPGDGLLVAVAPDLTAVTQFGQQLAVVVDSFATRWMRGEQRREHVLAPAFGQAQEGFLQFHSPARVVAGALHVAHSVQVRFAFGVA